MCMNFPPDVPDLAHPQLKNRSSAVNWVELYRSVMYRYVACLTVLDCTRFSSGRYTLPKKHIELGEAGQGEAGHERRVA
jgi:hypothetical protein